MNAKVSRTARCRVPLRAVVSGAGSQGRAVRDGKAICAKFSRSAHPKKLTLIARCGTLAGSVIFGRGRMTEVRIRNVEEWVVEWHRQQAKRDGQTLESELREVLTQAAIARKRSIAEEMRADLDRLRQKYGVFPDSAAAIRDERERRG